MTLNTWHAVQMATTDESQCMATVYFTNEELKTVANMNIIKSND